MCTKLQQTEIKSNSTARITKRAEAFQVAGQRETNWDAPIKRHSAIEALHLEHRSIAYLKKGITAFLEGIERVFDLQTNQL